MRIAYTFIISILFITSILAQDTDTSLVAGEVVISQNRLSLPLSQNARNIDIVSKAEIAELPVFNIPELLQYVGAIDIRRRGVNGTQSDAGIRGGTFNQVQILINGAKMNDPQTGHHMMNLPISLSDIERIEIIKGPAARVFGQNAFSGAINIITKIQDSDEVNMVAAVTLSSFETVQADLTLRVPTKDINQSLMFSHIGSEGYRYNTDYNINTLFYQADIKGIGNGLSVNAGYTDRKFGANGFYANEAFVDQYEEVTTSFISLTTLFTGENWTIRPRVNYRNNLDSYVFLRDNPSFFMNEHTGNTYQSELHFTYSTSLGITGFGVDVSQETLESNNLGDRDRSILGLFLEQRMTFLDDKLSITPGFYANKITDREFKIYPGIDVGFEINKGFSVFATANWSDRIPTYTNLYYSSRTEQGNPDLVAESATSLELGARLIKPNYNITASLWHRDNSNLIDWAKETEGQEKWLALNFNQVRMTGLDINSKFTIPGFITENRSLNLTLDYTYINATIQDNETVAVSRYALDNLRHQFILGAQLPILLNI